MTFWVHDIIFIVYSKSEVRIWVQGLADLKVLIRNQNRLRFEDKALLEECCILTGKTQYEVVMEGIKKVYAENTKK